MIAHLVGKVEEKFGNSLILDVSGVGYEITVPAPDFERVTLGETQKDSFAVWCDGGKIQ